MSKASIITAGLLLLPSVGFAGDPAVTVKAHPQNLATRANIGHQTSDQTASDTAINLHGDAIRHYWVKGPSKDTGRRVIIDKENDAIVRYGTKPDKPKAADPLGVVRAGLRQQSIPAHQYVAAHPTMSRMPLPPSQGADESRVYVPLAYTNPTNGQ